MPPLIFLRVPSPWGIKRRRNCLGSWCFEGQPSPAEASKQFRQKLTPFVSVCRHILHSIKNLLLAWYDTFALYLGPWSLAWWQIPLGGLKLCFHPLLLFSWEDCQALLRFKIGWFLTFYEDQLALAQVCDILVYTKTVDSIEGAR